MFLTDYNEVSNRTIIIDEDERTGWAYLTKPYNQSIDMDCWLYNKINTPNDYEFLSPQELPPPVPQKFLKSGYSWIITMDANKISFKWSIDGESVYILINNEILAFIDANSRKSFNVNLIEDCAWGKPFILS